MLGFLNLFKPKTDDFIKGKIEYSNDSYFELTFQKPEVTLQEYFILSLLVYSRMINLSNNELHKEMYSMFSDLSQLFKGEKFNNDEIYESYKDVFTKNYGAKPTCINISLRKNNANYFFLNSSTPYTKEKQKIVYIMFFHVFEKAAKNKRNLIAAFLKLGEISLQRKLTIAEATIIPNELAQHFFSLLDYYQPDYKVDEE